MSTDITNRPPPETAERNAAVTVARFEGRNHLQITVVITVLFSLYGALYLWLGPSFVADAAIEDLLESLPPIMNELFGFESLASLEGLFASEFYTFGWIVGFGGYLAYSAAGTVAGDLESERMDMLVAGPVSRWSVVLGKFTALFVPIAVVNLVVPLVLYWGSVFVGEPMSAVGLAALHLLSVPYLLFWSATGMVLGVVIRGGRRAGRVAIGLVFGSWIVESVLVTTEYDWTTLLFPTQYFDPPAILIDGTYDLGGALILLGATCVLLVGAVVSFRGRDF